MLNKLNAKKRSRHPFTQHFIKKKKAKLAHDPQNVMIEKRQVFAIFIFSVLFILTRFS